LTGHLKKRKKSRFLNLKKKRKKRFLELWLEAYRKLKAKPKTIAELKEAL